MKIKIVGFKVGKSKPVANRTLLILGNFWVKDWQKIGETLYKILEKSDFISIRRVD